MDVMDRRKNLAHAEGRDMLKGTLMTLRDQKPIEIELRWLPEKNEDDGVPITLNLQETC